MPHLLRLALKDAPRKMRRTPLLGTADPQPASST